MKRITLHIGHYGSGKTEYSLQKVIKLAGRGYKITLVDLDIVNPYFRSGEHEIALNALGIKVIKPNFEGTTVAVPSLPASVQSVFAQKDRYVVFDVGGDPSGATALGMYHRYLKSEDVETICVINTCRPFTSNAKDICHMIQKIEERSRLKVDCLVSNTNIARETTAQILMEGHDIIKEASKELGLPIKEICGLRDVLSALPVDFEPNLPRVELDLMMRPDWLK